jgi:hypothetical protein
VSGGRGNADPFATLRAGSSTSTLPLATLGTIAAFAQEDRDFFSG